MKVFQADTYREICNFVNENNLTKEHLFQIVREGEKSYTLIYFK